jgi:putative redox protein
VAGPVEVRWKKDGLRFEGKTVHGTIDLASSSDEKGAGATPMEALLVALGGCTGMDVASILAKMRQPLEEFWLEVNGQTAAEHPQRYTNLQVVYHFKGDLDEKKVRRAIELSETKYCRVEATLRPAVPIASRYVIEP